MAETIILIRRDNISGSIPPSGSLRLGELALNIEDGGLFYHNSGSDAVRLIRASSSLSSSYALTSSFALNAGAGGGGGGGGGGGPAIRSTVNLTTGIIASGSFETGTVELGPGFVLYQVSASSLARLRLYSSESFRDTDISRAVGTDPTVGEHGIIVDAVISGSPDFLVLDLAPFVVGADAKNPPDGFIAWTVNDLEGSAESKSFDLIRLELEASSSVTGSFTGSFTGTFFGIICGSIESASFADTASWANPELFTSFRPIKTVTSDPYVVEFQDFTVLVDASGAPIEVKLPAVSEFMLDAASKIINIIKIDAGTGSVDVLASGSETVIGVGTQSITDQYQSLTLQPSGSTWWVI
jgi:hypothetical protein